MNKIYEGRLDGANGPQVLVWHIKGRVRQFVELNPRYSECKHSPNGFAWGHHGNSPAQLAYALLRDMGYSQAETLSLYQYLKDVLVSRLPRDEPWTISENVLAMFVFAARKLAIGEKEILEI